MNENLASDKTALGWAEQLMMIIETSPYEEDAALHCIKKWSEQCRMEGVDVNDFFFKDGPNLTSALPQAVVDRAELSGQGSMNGLDPRISEKNIETLVLAIWEQGVLVDNINRDYQRGNLESSPWTVLQCACAKGLELMVKTSLAMGASIHRSPISGLTPLMVSAMKGQKDLLRYLVSIGSNPNDQEGRWGETALLYATSSYPGTVKLLMDLGAKVNMTNYAGYHALSKAAFHSDREQMKHLIEGGSELDMKTKNGETACHSAVWFNKVENLKCLVEAGANFKIQDRNGLTPLMLAKDKGYLDIVMYLEGVEQALIDRHALEKALPMVEKDNRGHLTMNNATKKKRI